MNTKELRRTLIWNSQRVVIPTNGLEMGMFVYLLNNRRQDVALWISWVRELALGKVPLGPNLKKGVVHLSATQGLRSKRNPEILLLTYILHPPFSSLIHFLNFPPFNRTSLSGWTLTVFVESMENVKRMEIERNTFYSTLKWYCKTNSFREKCNRIE